MNEKKKSPRLLAILITAVAGAVGAVGGRMAVEQFVGKSDKDAKFDQALVQAADELNRNLPMMVDDVTRLDSTIPLPGRKFVYKYTIIGVKPEELDKNAFIKQKRLELITHYKTSPDMKNFRQNQVELSYFYALENGTTFAEIAVSPEDF